MCYRNKFRGRNKRDNMIKQDSMVLVGMREWQYMAAKKKKRLIYYIFILIHKFQILKNYEFNQDILAEISKDNEDDGIVFTHEEDDDEDSAFVFENTNHKVLYISKPNKKMMILILMIFKLYV